MNQSLKKLRRKYCITASLFVFVVIFFMVIMINVFMQINYNQEKDIIADTIVQAIEAHSQQNQM